MRLLGLMLVSAVALPALFGAGGPASKGGPGDYVKILSAEVRGKLRLPGKIAVAHPAGITAYVEVGGFPRYWLDLSKDDALRMRAQGWRDRTVVVEGAVETRPAVDAYACLRPGSPGPVVSVLMPRTLKLGTGEK